MIPAQTGDRRNAARAGDDENIYIVTYDIAAPRRWRRVFRIMEGYGEWLQLSVFQCRLSRRRRVELKLALEEVIDRSEDHVVILDLGPVTGFRPRVESLGKPFSAVERGPVIVQYPVKALRLADVALADVTRALLRGAAAGYRSQPLFDIVEKKLLVHDGPTLGERNRHIVNRKEGARKLIAKTRHSRSFQHELVIPASEAGASLKLPQFDLDAANLCGLSPPVKPGPH